MGYFDLLAQTIHPFIAERLGKIHAGDDEYQMRLKAENSIYEQLNETLSEKQAEELEQYLIAANEAAARKETLAYIQGMKDLLALLKTLS